MRVLASFVAIQTPARHLDRTTRAHAVAHSATVRRASTRVDGFDGASVVANAPEDRNLLTWRGSAWISRTLQLVLEHRHRVKSFRQSSFSGPCICLPSLGRPFPPDHHVLFTIDHGFSILNDNQFIPDHRPAVHTSNMLQCFTQQKGPLIL